MGTTAYDFDINVSISMPSEALVGKIMEPNGINIIFEKALGNVIGRLWIQNRIMPV